MPGNIISMTEPANPTEATPEPALSVIIPAFNEVGRIERALDAVEAYAAADPSKPVELIVVDDGSSDDTVGFTESHELTAAHLRVIRHETNRGKGAAVRTGMLAARGRTVLMCDADMSTPIEDVARLADALDAGSDIAIGSRIIAGAVVDPPQPPLRRFMGWGFRTLRRVLMLGDLIDTQCGFKLFTRDAAHAVFAHVESDGFAFDCEVLAIARRLDLRIKEVPVNWANRGDSTLTALDAPRMFADLLRIRSRVKKLDL